MTSAPHASSAPKPRVRRVLYAAAAAVILVAGLTWFMNTRTNSRAAAPHAGMRPAARTPDAVPLVMNAAWTNLVAEATSTRRLPFPEYLEALRAVPDPLRSPSLPDASSPLEPAGIVVASPRPLFRWTAFSGPARYVVSVFEGPSEVTTSKVIEVPEWTPPMDLPAGRTLTWQVEVTRDGTRWIVPAPPAPPALFRIATASDRAEIADALARHPEDHLLHAVLLARAGLEAEANAALNRAVASGDRRADGIPRSAR